MMGSEGEPVWFENQVKAKYELEHSGPGAHQLQWTAGRIEYEPDQTHSEIIIKEMGMEGAKPSASSGAAETPEVTRLLDASPDMSGSDATAYRGLAPG